MRFPLVRIGGDDSPTAAWEWLFAPIVLPILILPLACLALLSIPYFALYPERHAHVWDFEGTETQRRQLARRRERYSRFSFRQRVYWWWKRRQ